MAFEGLYRAGSAAGSNTSTTKAGWDWGAIGTAALQAVGSMQGSSDTRAASKEEWAARLEQTRLTIAGQRDLVSQTRGYQLQDRAWNREQIGNYRQFDDGPPSKPVAPISTEVVNAPQTPGVEVAPPPAAAAAKPVKKPKKPSTLRRILGGGLF